VKPGSYSISIWDPIAQSIVGVDKTGASTANPLIDADAFTLSSEYDGGYIHLIGGVPSSETRFDEIVVGSRVLTATEIENIRLGTYLAPGQSPPSASLDELPVWPAIRPPEYDANLFWQPGAFDWGTDYVTTGGGRWNQQLVVAGNKKIYYEELE
jgi:hypothetical protein